MDKNTKKVWRLKTPPTAEQLASLVGAGVLTKDEAKDILLEEKVVTERSVESLESEIRFLRELVQKLSDGKRELIVKQIEVIKGSERISPWFAPYVSWSTTVSGSGSTAYVDYGGSAGHATGGLANYGTGGNNNAGATGVGPFTSIVTF